MGEPLVGLLGEAGNEVHVTTRQERNPLFYRQCP